MERAGARAENREEGSRAPANQMARRVQLRGRGGDEVIRWMLAVAAGVALAAGGPAEGQRGGRTPIRPRNDVKEFLMHSLTSAATASGGGGDLSRAPISLQQLTLEVISLSGPAPRQEPRRPGGVRASRPRIGNWATAVLPARIPDPLAAATAEEAPAVAAEPVEGEEPSLPPPATIMGYEGPVPLAGAWGADILSEGRAAKALSTPGLEDLSRPLLAYPSLGPGLNGLPQLVLYPRSYDLPLRGLYSDEETQYQQAHGFDVRPLQSPVVPHTSAGVAYLESPVQRVRSEREREQEERARRESGQGRPSQANRPVRPR